MNFKKNLVSPPVGFQMAPMIDIVFLLLMFFMAATIYAQWETKMGIQVPTAETGISAPRPPGEIIVNLDEDGKIYVNNAEMGLSRLEELLKQIADIYREQPVIIRADQKTKHKDVMAVLDICRRVDIWNVAFATVPPEAGTP